MLRNTFSVMRNADSDAVFSVFFKFIKDCFKLYFFTDVLEFLRRQYPAKSFCGSGIIQKFLNSACFRFSCVILRQSFDTVNLT